MERTRGAITEKQPHGIGRLRRVRGGLGVTALVSVAYYLGAELGLGLALVRGQVTPLWPPTGIAVVALLLFGRRALPGIALGAFAVNAPIGPTLPAAAGIAAGNTLAPFAVHAILQRARFRGEIDRLRDALALCSAALVGMLLSASVGTAILLAAGGVARAQFWPTWSVWWTGDAMGVLVVAPFLLVLRRVRLGRGVATNRLWEPTLVFAGLIAVSVVAFRTSLPMLFLVFPLLTWAAWRFEQRGAAPAVLTTSLIAIFAAANGSGPFSGGGLFVDMVILQAFNGVAALTSFFLAAMTLERNRAREDLEQARAHLEKRVRERTAELEATIDRLERSEHRLEEAQRVARIGSWEWDIRTNVVTWTDELYRLCGLEPQSIAVDYESFLARVHPDDREMVRQTVDRAYRDSKPFSFDHRVVRPDGSVRWLHGRGNVLAGDGGVPIKMFGTGQDIEERKRSEARFAGLLEGAPDAILVVDSGGTIRVVNRQAEALFGYDRDELAGQRIEILIPVGARRKHPRLREGFFASPRARPMGAGLDLSACKKDGAEFPVDIALNPIVTDEGTFVSVAIRDVTERKKAESAARDLREAEFRRLQALEINDVVVQGLTTAVYALEASDAPWALSAVRHTLGAARRMMAKLFSTASTLAPGDLVRAEPATVTPDAGNTATVEAQGHPARSSTLIRVVIADDTPDIRLVLRSLLDPRQGFDVVGEASDGAEAVRLVEEHRPDVAILDLGMPVMDGLQATSEIRARAPETKVVVLSGYGKEQVAAQALSLGAAAYLEKGGSTQRLIALLRELCPHKIATGVIAGPNAPVPAGVRTPAAVRDEQQDLISTYTHELRNPLTALLGISATLAERGDQLPSPLAKELLEGVHRNARQMSALVDALADARTIGADELTLALELGDVGALVRQTLADLAPLIGERTVTVEAPDGVVAPLDAFRVRQVITNLLSNAVKFSPAGAPIEVSVAPRPPVVVITVVDHGTGVAPEGQGRLFGKFERLGAKGKGVGLGLYLSRGIARAHGGDVVLARTGDGGSTFLLTLPLVSGARPPEPAAASLASEDRGSYRT